MKTNSERQAHFAFASSPTPDNPEYKAWVDAADTKIRNDPKLRKRLRANQEKAMSYALTQSQNGIGLLMDKELRFFHVEFNTRIWKHGFGALPSSFNTMEAFFKWNPKIFYFELIEEVEHLFSFYDFFDFITSKNCSGALEGLVDRIQDGLIYTYNILNRVKDLSFKTKDSKEYYIGGVSFVRRGSEVTILMIAGEHGDLDQITNSLEAISEGGKIRPYLSAAEDRSLEAVQLLDNKDLWKVNVYIRIDLSTMSIDARYVQKDAGKVFNTYTDDLGAFGLNRTKSDDLTELYKIQMKEVENYEPIFEVAYNCLFLPEYFDFFEDDVVPEEHPTGLVNETIKRSALGKPKFSSSFFKKLSDVWVLDQNTHGLSQDAVIAKTELKISTDGYWQYLRPGEIGADKNGKPIHNRTWVTQTLAWRETIPNQNVVDVKIVDQNQGKEGYIYVLRNPAHALDIFKIGLTTKTVEERASQLSGTPSPDKFLIVHRWHVKDCIAAEKLIHDALAKFRVNERREFFKVDLEHIMSTVSSIVAK